MFEFLISEFTTILFMITGLLVVLGTVVLLLLMRVFAIGLLFYVRLWRPTVAGIACGTATFYWARALRAEPMYLTSMLYPSLAVSLGIAIAIFATSDRKALNSVAPQELNPKAKVTAISGGLIGAMIGAISGVGKPVINAIFGLEFSELAASEQFVIRGVGAVLGVVSGAILFLIARAIYLGPCKLEFNGPQQEFERTGELPEATLPDSTDSSGS